MYNSYDLTFSIISPPQFGEYNLNASFLTYTPNENYFGTDQLTYIVSDGELNSNVADIIYDVQGINDAPELPELPDVIITEDETYTIDIPIYDVDTDSLEYTINFLMIMLHMK